jgi:hypothetical protein
MSFAAIETVLGILLGAGLTMAVAALLGRVLLARLLRGEPVLTRAEGWLFSFATGAPLLSLTVFFLAATGLAYDWVFVLLALCSAGAAWLWGRQLPTAPAPPPETDAGVWWGVFSLVAIAYAYVYIPNALAPEIQADAVGYHFGLVGHTYRAHGFPGITTNLYAFLSQGAEMLYLFAYAIGRHSAAKFFHFILFAATLAALTTFARRYRVVRAGAFGAGLYLCAPVVGPDATSAYNDCGLAFFGFMTFYATMIWWRERRPAWLVVAGVLAGFCFSIKYTGAVALPALASVVAWGTWRRLRDPRLTLRRTLLVGVVASCFVIPWLAKNSLVTGNPVAPFFNEYFPNQHVTTAWENTYRKYLRGYSHDPDTRRQNLAAAPLEVTLRGERFQGIVGPIFLLAPLAFFAYRHPLLRLLLIAAAVAAIPWFSNSGTRFLIPPLVFVSLAMGLTLYRLPRRVSFVTGGALLLLHGLASWPALMPRWHPEWHWALEDTPWAAALRIEPEAVYLRRKVPWYRTAEFLRAHSDSATRILSLEPLPEAYFDGQVLTSYQGAANEELGRVLVAGIEPDYWPSREMTLSWTPQTLTGLRVVQTAAHESREWSLSEIRLFAADEEVIPRSDWNLRAWPFPWTAARAFDGNPWTPWNTWRILQPNMFIEVAFPNPVQLSRAVIIHPRGQHFSEFVLIGRTTDGHWKPLKVESSFEFRPTRLAEGLAWAGAELHRAGIAYLVVNAEGEIYNMMAPAIAADPSAWGLEEAFVEGPLRTYRVLEP